MTALAHFRALGTLVVVGTTDDGDLDRVVDAVRAEIADCDAGCSRFRSDSDLSRLNASAGAGPVEVGPWLYGAVLDALAVAASTDGLVDPTIGASLLSLGYDRDIAQLDPRRPVEVVGRPVPGWQRIALDSRRRTVRLPRGVTLDLGATAKARCADLAAARAAELTPGVLVSLGGDMRMIGRSPDGGWRIRVTDRADTDPGDTGPGQTVTMHDGAIATSGTAARRWHRSGRDLHHLLDPRTGLPAMEVWRTVTSTAPTCLDANAATTAAVVAGADAPAWLEARGLAARLVAADGTVTRVGPWPADTDRTEGRAA